MRTEPHGKARPVVWRVKLHALYSTTLTTADNHYFTEIELP